MCVLIRKDSPFLEKIIVSRRTGNHSVGSVISHSMNLKEREKANNLYLFFSFPSYKKRRVCKCECLCNSSSGRMPSTGLCTVFDK